MKRRTFILTSTAATVTIILPLSNCSTELGFDEILAYPVTLLHINGTKTIREVGDFYLKLMPDEATKSILKNLILENKNGENISKSANKILLQNSISKKIKYDYMIGNTIIIYGWILSKTEARQCALYSLINS